jgi:hypothetical protein
MRTKVNDLNKVEALALGNTNATPLINLDVTIFFIIALMAINIWENQRHS